MTKQTYDPFGLETETVQADWWPEGMTVTVTELSYEAVQRTAKHLINAKTPLPKSKRENKRIVRTYGDLDTANQQWHTTLAGIVSWTFTGKDGKPMAVNLENVKNLRSRDAKFIEEAIDELNPDDSDDEDFPSGHSDSVTDGEGKTSP